MTPRHLLKPARLAGAPLLATQSDERLVDLVRAGSGPAFDAVVSRYRGQLVRYCAAIVGRERAEDVVQQAFVNAFNAMQRDENDLNLKPWLYRIAHNASLNALRERALRDEQLDLERADALDPGLPAEQPDQALERRDELAAVFAAVQSLPPRQRDAIVLRELEGRSYDEIATALGVGGGSVRALLHRARNSVRMAATAVTPVGLLLRIPPAGTEAGESVAGRVAELTAGVGAGAVTSKVAATVLVTGAVAGGVALGPGQGDSRPVRGQDDAGSQQEVTRGAPPADLEGGSGSDDGSSGPGDDGDGDREDRSGPSERSGSGGGDDRSGPSDRSGPGDGDALELDNSGPGSGGESNSGPGSDSSGPGDGDLDSDSGSGGSGSGTSGSGTSGSGTSGSGTSGSGTSGSGTSGSGTSGSGSGSGSSGSGSDYSGSGSGSSGSGSGSGSGDATPDLD